MQMIERPRIAQQVLERFGAVEQEPLRVVDPDLAQLGKHLGPVHEFCYGLYADYLRYIHKAANRRLVQRVLDEVPDKLPVDFQVVHGKRFEVSERGGAGAEVIERHLDSEGSDALNEPRGLGKVGDRCGFGDLETEALADA